MSAILSAISLVTLITLIYVLCCCSCYIASVVSDSVRPHRRRPTRLPRPWDSPGKNTGVGCHFLLQCMKVKGESEVAQLCLTLHNLIDCSLPGSSVHGSFQARVLQCIAISFQLFAAPWNLPCQAPLPMEFSGKNIGTGCHFLFQGIFLIQGSNPNLLHYWKADALPLAPPGKPIPQNQVQSKYRV